VPFDVSFLSAKYLSPIALTRSLTSRVAVGNCESFIDIALKLRERVEMAPQQLFRLVGVGLSNFKFDDDPVTPALDG
jgi:DNA polymerase-4